MVPYSEASALNFRAYSPMYLSLRCIGQVRTGEPILLYPGLTFFAALSQLSHAEKLKRREKSRKASAETRAILFGRRGGIRVHILRKCKLWQNPFISHPDDRILKPNSTLSHFSLCWMTQPCAQVFPVNGSIIFDVNGSIICSGLHFWRHWFKMTKFLVNSSCVWWIMRVVLTNPKRGNILNG